MSEQRLLDTNLVIALLERESEVVQRVLALDDVLMSVVVLGELQLGARASSRPDENLERIERMLKWTTIVP